MQINLLRNLHAVLHAVLYGAQNPHVLTCTFRFLRTMRLASKPLVTVYEGDL